MQNDFILSEKYRILDYAPLLDKYVNLIPSVSPPKFYIVNQNIIFHITFISNFVERN